MVAFRQRAFRVVMRQRDVNPCMPGPLFVKAFVARRIPSPGSKFSTACVPPEHQVIRTGGRIRQTAGFFIAAPSHHLVKRIFTAASFEGPVTIDHNGQSVPGILFLLVGNHVQSGLFFRCEWRAALDVSCPAAGAATAEKPAAGDTSDASLFRKMDS